MRGSVHGYVLVAPDDQPVAGATIVGSSEAASVRAGAPPPVPPAEITTRTDSTGRFAFDGLREGTWTLQTRGAGGETLAGATVHVFDNAVSEITLALKTMPAVSPEPPAAGGSVRGRAVRVDSGEPVGGARISIVSGEGAEPEVAPVTGPDGWFLIEDLPAGHWLLRAVGPGGESGNATVHVFDNAVSDVAIEVGVLPRPRKGLPRSSRRTEQAMPGSIRGLVLRADTSNPVAQATITIVQGAGPAPDIAPVTDDDGRFALDGLPPGDWVLRAAGPRGEAGEGSAHVTAGTISELVIKVQPRRRTSSS